MDDAERIKWVKGVALSTLTLNSAYYLALIHKQNQTIKELVNYGRELIRISEHGKFIIDTIMEDAILTTEAENRIDDKITLWRLDYEMMAEPGIAEKTSLLMRSYPSTQGDTMTDQTVQPAEAQDQTPPKQPSWLRRQSAAHPKITNAAKLTAAALGIVAVTRAVTNAQHNKERVQEGLDHAKEAADALSDSVTLDES